MVSPSECPRPSGLIECGTVFDIGPGIRPMGWYTPARHVCVEPCPAYAVRLRAKGYQVVEQRAVDFLAARRLPSDSAVYLLDVIEHMDWEDGLRTIALLLSERPKQIVVFTPNGFLPQSGDAWGLGGDSWQLHRSGWMPADFPGWEIERLAAPHDSFLAVWTRQ